MKNRFAAQQVGYVSIPQASISQNKFPKKIPENDNSLIR